MDEKKKYTNKDICFFNRIERITNKLIVIFVLISSLSCLLMSFKQMYTG